MNHLLERQPEGKADIHITVGYSETREEVTVCLDYGYVDYNPMAAEDDDDLSLLLVKKQVKRWEYDQGGSADGGRARLMLYL